MQEMPTEIECLHHAEEGSETASVTSPVEVSASVSFLNAHNERRNALLDQTSVKRWQDSRHPARRAPKASAVGDDDSSDTCVYLDRSDHALTRSDDSLSDGDDEFVEEGASSFDGAKTDFFRYQYDLDVCDWPQVKNEEEATRLLGKASELALSKTRGVRWTKNSDGSLEYHLCSRPFPTIERPFSNGQSLVKTLFACIQSWLEKATKVQLDRYSVLLEDPAAETLFWSTATDQGKCLLDVVADQPELFASRLPTLSAATFESSLPNAKVSGIYLLQGLLADQDSAKPELYVGQTSYFVRRWKQHFMEAHPSTLSAKSSSLVYQSLQKVHKRGGQVSALPLSQLDTKQHAKWACLFEIAWTMVFRSYQGSESYLHHAAGCGLPYLDIVGLNTDHGGGREYTNGNALNGVNPSLDEIVWDMRSLHFKLLTAQSIALLPLRYSRDEIASATKQAMQHRTNLEERKADYAKEKGELLIKGELFISFAYYTTQKAQWMAGTFFGLGITELTLLRIFTKEELDVAKAARCAIVQARIVDHDSPALPSDFFLMLTESQRACVGGISIVLSNPATGKAAPWQQRLSLSQTAKLTRAFRFVSGIVSTSAWRREEVERVFRSMSHAFTGLEGVAKRLWQGEQSCKTAGKCFLFNQVECDGETTSGWLLPKEPKLQDFDFVGVGIFVRVVMDSEHHIFRGRIHQNEEEELAIACLGLQFFSLQHGWIDIRHAYTSGGGCIFEQCLIVWRMWFAQQSETTKHCLQQKLPRGVVKEDDAADLAGEPLLFQKFLGVCQQRNRILVPRDRFEDRKTCKISIPAAMAAAWGFSDGAIPRNSLWEVKIDAWGKTQEDARILVRRTTRGKYDNVWLTLDEYRVSTLSAYTISGLLWDECQKSNEFNLRS